MKSIACSSCSAQIDAGAKFCPECGAPLGVKSPASKKLSAKEQQKAARNHLLIVVTALAVVIVAFFVYQSMQPDPPSQVTIDSPHNGADMGGMGASMPDLPTDYAGLVNTGNHSMDDRNFALAAECYRRALIIDGSSPDVRTDFAACLHGMGLANRAAEEFKNVLANHPEHKVANFNLGFVYFTTNQFDSSKAYFQQYLKNEPSGGQADAARDYIKQLEEAVARP